jgi:uncharacterized LabA/DUF88 family protein
MRIRRIAILIDGGFFLKRLPKLLDPAFCTTPKQVAESARHLCKRHVLRLTGADEGQDADGRWLDHVYRLFFYDATPYEGVSHHPILNERIEFAKTDVAEFRKQLFNQLRRKRKFALRLGHVNKESEWRINPRLTKKLLKTRDWIERIDKALLKGEGVRALSHDDALEMQRLLDAWRSLDERSVAYGLRQKGVDMRVGLDIASIALKKQADTVILVTGDSDFVPAAKLARREGVEFIVDPLWQSVSDDLFEHVDGIITVFQKPRAATHPGGAQA